jgi:hypothetical protein
MAVILLPSEKPAQATFLAQMVVFHFTPTPDETHLGLGHETHFAEFPEKSKLPSFLLVCYIYNTIDLII